MTACGQHHFSHSENIIIQTRTQNDVTPCGVNDVMLRIDLSPFFCYYKEIPKHISDFCNKKSISHSNRSFTSLKPLFVNLSRKSNFKELPFQALIKCLLPNPTNNSGNKLPESFFYSLLIFFNPWLKNIV